MSCFAIIVLYGQCYFMSQITGKWWVGVVLAGLVTHLGLFVFARDHHGDLGRLWVIVMGTKITVPWQINGPSEYYQGSTRINGDPSEAACEARLFIDENFHPRDYVYTKNREIIFRRKSDAVMFKLACGPFV